MMLILTKGTASPITHLDAHHGLGQIALGHHFLTEFRQGQNIRMFRHAHQTFFVHEIVSAVGSRIRRGPRRISGPNGKFGPTFRSSLDGHAGTRRRRRGWRRRRRGRVGRSAVARGVRRLLRRRMAAMAIGNVAYYTTKAQIEHFRSNKETRQSIASERKIKPDEPHQQTPIERKNPKKNSRRAATGDGVSFVATTAAAAALLCPHPMVQISQALVCSLSFRFSCMW